MKWNELTVMAARTTKEMGAAISNPIVRTLGQNGKMFLLRDVNVDDPEPNTFISPEEVKKMIDSEDWTQLPEWSAQKGKVVVVISHRLAELAFVAGLPLDEFKTPSEFRRAVYLSCEAAKRWRESFVDKLLAWADEQVRQHFSSGGGDHTLNGLEEPYRHARFLCINDKERLTSVYTALITLSARRLKVIVDLAGRDLGMSPTQLSNLAGKRAQNLIPD